MIGFPLHGESNVAMTGVRKKTFIGLLTSFSSFTLFSYTIGLVKTLVDRTLRICNTWQAFNEEIKFSTTILKKNLYPFRLIERIINNRSVTQHVTSNSGKCTGEQLPNTFYFELKRKLLEQRNITLEEVLEKTRAWEMAGREVTNMTTRPQQEERDRVNAVKVKQGKEGEKSESATIVEERVI